MFHADYYEGEAMAARAFAIGHRGALAKCAKCGEQACTDYTLDGINWTPCPHCGTHGEYGTIVDGAMLCGNCY